MRFTLFIIPALVACGPKTKPAAAPTAEPTPTAADLEGQWRSAC